MIVMARGSHAENVRSLQNNTSELRRMRTPTQFIYIHKPVYGSSAFA
jgi:hypothetical protein